MNVSISLAKLDRSQRELAGFRITRDLILSVIADSRRYNSPIDIDWIEMMLKDCESQEPGILNR